MELTKRQNLLIKTIIEEYIATATPVGSKILMEKYFKNLSSATIRNEMLYLEKMNYVEKMHTSSGRIPSLKGYKYYEENILEPNIDQEIKYRLKKVLSDRSKSIDQTIEASATFINEITKLPSVITHVQTDDRLCRIDLIKLNNKTALVLVVSSTGDVIKNSIKFDNPKQYKDISICINVFNDRLVDSKFSEIPLKLKLIKNMIKNMVHEYEYVVHEIVNKIFDFNTKYKNDVYGAKSLIKQPEFLDRDKLIKIIDLLENTSIWEHIAYLQQKTGKTTITFGDEIGINGISVASTTVKTNDGKKHQIAVVGPTRMDYSKIKGLLSLFKEEIEKIGNNNEKTKNID